MTPIPVRIAGTGCYLPEKLLTNDMLHHICGVTPEWIMRRSGIEQRHLAAREEAASDLAIHASRQALEASGITADELDGILVATATPDTVIPSTAARVQAALCRRPVPGYDCSAACAGFLFALMAGVGQIGSGLARRVLVIGTEVRSRLTDYTDPNTAILYGDGAGAVVLERSPVEGDGEAAFLAWHAGSDGRHGNLVTLPAGGSLRPATEETVAEHLHYIHLDGPPLFRIGVRAVVDSIQVALGEAGLSLDDIALVVPHQMNQRMLDAIAERLGVAPERFFTNVRLVGNTSAAAIPIALAQAVREGRIVRGDLVCLATFGGGLSWGTAILRW